MSFKERLAERLFGDVIEGRVQAAVKVVDDRWWEQLQGGAGTADRPWHERTADLDDALEAWRSNFLVRQVVRLTTAYVVGDGIMINSENARVSTFISRFLNHRQNRIPLRLYAMCDELTRSGELFPVLFTNRADGMSYIRFVPARQIHRIDTAPDDYERELYYYQSTQDDPVNGRRWASPETAKPGEPVMLHYAVNRPIGAVRGESDLLPVLPWARRYTEWLKDRVRFNRLRTRMAIWDVTVEDDSQVRSKQAQYRRNPPGDGSIVVHGKGEQWDARSGNIEGGDAEPDGKALRLAVGAGANIPLHFLAEGDSATKATASEMGGPTLRHYTQRQLYFVHILQDIVAHAWRRRSPGESFRSAGELKMSARMPEVATEDNLALANSARAIVEALALMKGQGWITDEIAVPLAFKFAGELITDEQIASILKSAGKGGK